MIASGEGLKIGMMPFPPGGFAVAGGGGLQIGLGVERARTAVLGFLGALGIITLSESVDQDNDSSPTEEAGERQDLKQPGVKYNPDGTPKNPEDQLQEMEEGVRTGRTQADDLGKSQNEMNTKFRRMRGRSASEVLKELEKNQQ